MKQVLLEYISDLLKKTEKAGLLLDSEKEINYGIQLIFIDGMDKLPVSIYHSKKKGISLVLGGGKSNPLKKRMETLLYPTEKKDLVFKCWAGTDESGKGDFFGPLVVSGVVLDQKSFPKVKAAGVMDSKLLSDTKIREIVPKIYAILDGKCETIILNPLKYNDLYKKFRSQGKKLNELLAWMHGRVILNLAGKYDLEAIIVDKFANERVLENAIKDIKKMKIIQRVRAEEDLAVACASILSRYHYISQMDNLSNKYKLVLPKGASKKVKQVGSNFAKIYGKNRLIEVAKIHFKTFNEIEV